MNEHDLIDLIKQEMKKHYANFEIQNEKKRKEEISFLGKDVLLKNDLEESFDIIEGADKIVVSELGIRELFELSQGTYSSEIGEKLLYSIAEGKQILFVKEGMEWRNISSIPSKLQEKYREYEGLLEMYGAKIVSRIEMKDYLRGETKYYKGKLLDLRTLKDSFYSNGAYIEISENTTVTELAKEYAAENNIKILKR